MQTDVISIPSSSNLKTLQQVLADNMITGVLVIDDNDKPIGVASQQDVIVHQKRKLDRPLFDDDFGGVPSWKKAPRQLTVADIMTPLLLSLPADKSPAQAARLLLKEGMHRIFVTQNQKIVGILTPMDLLHVVANMD